MSSHESSGAPSHTPPAPSEYNLVHSRLIRGRFALTRRRAGGCGCPSPDCRRLQVTVPDPSFTVIHRNPVPSQAAQEAPQTVAMPKQRRPRTRRSAPTFADHAARVPIVTAGTDPHDPDLPSYTRKTTEKSEVPLVFGVDDPSGAGLTRAQALAGDSMRAPHYGVRLSSRTTETVEHPGWAEPQWFAVRSRLAALQTLRPDAIGSHTSAAELLGIPLPSHLRGRHAPIHVLSPVTNAVQARGAHGHRGSLTEPSVTTGGVEVTGHLQTVMQLAPLLAERDLVVAIDALIGPWRGSPVALEQIDRHMRENPGRRGARKLRNARARARPGVGSPRESEIRLDLVDWGFPEPAVGRAVWIAELRRHLTRDLLYEDIRTAIEYEGEQHRTNRWQVEADIERANAVRSAGYFVERLTKRTGLVELIGVLTERFAALRAGTLRFPSAH